MANLKLFKFWGRSPLTIVEMIIGFSSIIGGLYLVSPLLSYSVMTNGATPLVATIANPIALICYGVFLLIAGALVVAGIIKRKYRWRSSGLFMIILIRTYGLLVGFLVAGFLPLTWLASLVVLLTAVVCYIVVRGFVTIGGGD